MKKRFFWAAGMLLAFVLWTRLVCTVDVRPIGPNGSAVGFATVNGGFHRLTGVHMIVYHITDWLGLVPVFTGFGFAVLGLVQWIRRKHICKVDLSILLLGGFYIVTFAVYILFEYVVINRRPVLIGGFLEASYPSSTTMLALCVMPTAMMQLRGRIKNRPFRRCVTVSIGAFTAFMVIGRLLSGVHWLTDIVGGILVSGGLVLLYGGLCGLERNRM